MSWADLARKKVDDEVKVGANIKVMAVIDSVAHDEDAKRRNVLAKTVMHNLPEIEKGLLVLDTNAFVKGLDGYLSLADVLVTIPQVLQECKDRATRDILERLPVNLHVLDPSPESIKRVNDMAALTGDLGAMSRTDLRLCALALDCAEQTKCINDEIVPAGSHINPDDKKVTIVSEMQDEPAAEGDDEEDNEAEAEVEAPKKKAEKKADALPGWGDADDDWGSDEEDDGEGAWITPTNITEQAPIANQNTFTGGTACATSDFPMQNTLLHLGVHICGPNGSMIRELRQWLLRCHACYCTVHDTTRQFCPDCGSGNTLKRVNYVVTQTGEKQLFINFKHTISKRGTVYTLPKPRGGRNGTNKTLALREDQLANCGNSSRHQKQRRVEADDDLAAFGTTHGSSGTRSMPNQSRIFSSYRKYNVNERKKAKAGGKK
jgi:RNA-binding protein NOB1